MSTIITTMRGIQVMTTIHTRITRRKNNIGDWQLIPRGRSFFGSTQKFKMRFLAKPAISRTRDHRHWIRKPKVAFLENLGRASPPSRELAFGYKLVAEKQTVKWRHHVTPNVNHYRNYYIYKSKKSKRRRRKCSIKGNIIEWSFKKIWAWPVSLI